MFPHEPGQGQTPKPAAGSRAEETNAEASSGARGAHKGKCELCQGLGGIARHEKAGAEYQRTLWVAHEIPSRTHPVLECPQCAYRQLLVHLGLKAEAFGSPAQWAFDEATRLAPTWFQAVPPDPDAYLYKERPRPEGSA